ncbi:MAG: GntR family transcriptional regulator [Muribaculaceae bacterium]
MFKENNKAIYLQIAERIYDDIQAGNIRPGDRLPSVRDYAVLVQVNPNTVMRTYETLTREEIIVNRRGIGFFLTEEAPEKVRNIRITRLKENDLPEIFRRLSLLGITPDELTEAYKKYLITALKK